MALTRPSRGDDYRSSLFPLILVGIAGIRRAMQPPKTNAELIAEALTALGSVQAGDPRLHEALSAATLSVTKCLPLALQTGQPQPAIQPQPAKSEHDTADEEDDELTGASKVEVAIAAIREAGHGLRITEILEAFKQKGREEWASPGGAGSLLKAMVRRAKHSGDVFKMPGNHQAWDITARYDPTELAIILSTETIAQDVARDKQSKRTKEGLARARARGKRMGKEFKLTREEAIRFKQMLREGKRPFEIRDAFKISSGSVYNYSRRLKNWDEVNGPWPPAEPSKQFKPVLRVVQGEA